MPIEDQILSKLGKPHRTRSLFLNRTRAKCKRLAPTLSRVFTDGTYITENNICRLFSALGKLQRQLSSAPGSVLAIDGLKDRLSDTVEHTLLRLKGSHRVYPFMNLRRRVRAILTLLDYLAERSREVKGAAAAAEPYDTFMRPFVPLRALAEIIAFLKITSVSQKQRQSKRKSIAGDRRDYFDIGGIRESFRRRTRITAPNYDYGSYLDQDGDARDDGDGGRLWASVLRRPGEPLQREKIMRALRGLAATKYAMYTPELLREYQNAQTRQAKTKMDTVINGIATFLPLQANKSGILDKYVTKLSREDIYTNWLNLEENKQKIQHEVLDYCFLFSVEPDNSIFHALFVSMMRKIVFNVHPKRLRNYYKHFVGTVKDVCALLHDRAGDQHSDAKAESVTNVTKLQLDRALDGKHDSDENFECTDFFKKFYTFLLLYSASKKIWGARSMDEIRGVTDTKFDPSEKSIYLQTFVELFPWFEVYVFGATGATEEDGAGVGNTHGLLASYTCESVDELNGVGLDDDRSCTRRLKRWYSERSAPPTENIADDNLRKYKIHGRQKLYLYWDEDQYKVFVDAENSYNALETVFNFVLRR